MRPSVPVSVLVRTCAASCMAVAAVNAGEASSDKQMAIEVSKAGPDYAVQGDYLGESGGKPLAAQVIALGGGSFRAVFEPGGFPGEGWDGATRVEVEGKTAGEKTPFGESGYHGTISGDAFSGTTAAGTAFTLKKVLRVSPTALAKPPAGALVLFDGSNTDAWKDAKIETLDGEKVLNYGAETRKNFTSYQLHVEFREPFKPFGRGQDRGNSGIYIHHTYEIQVLDSYGLKPENNDIGSLYTVVTPLVNACYPPLSWQTYDIDWQGPTFDAAGAKTKNAMVTVKLNGLLVLDHTEVKSGTGANKKKPETPQGGPLWLQDHHNPVYFRNIWLVGKP
jgi:hypothetical protein